MTRKALERSACALARAGHSMIWDYSWDLFVAAIDEMNESNKK